MSKRTEYQELKRYLFAVKDYTNRLTAIDANTMIQDACESAYNGLDMFEKRHVKEAKYALADNVKHLGEKGALELLAAIGDHMNGCEDER